MFDSLPLVSIVIPSYNHLNYLQTSINSIINQDYPHIELIVLDDGSTDGSAEFLQQYKGRFHVESHANMGQSATLNKGWRMSKGEIIGYLSADDILFPSAVRFSVDAFMENQEIVLTYVDNILIDTNSKKIRNVNFPELSFFEMINYMHSHIGVGSFFLKSAFEKIGGWNVNLKYIADYEYQLKLARIGQFKHIKKYLAYYRAHSNSATYSSVPFSSANEYQRVIKHFLAVVPDKEVLAIREKLLSRAYLMSARAHWRSGRFKICFKYFLISIKVYPMILLLLKTYVIIGRALFGRQIYKAISFFRR